MILYSKDIEMLLTGVSGAMMFTEPLKKLPFVGKLFQAPEVDKYRPLRDKLLQAQERCEFLEIDKEDVPVVIEICQVGLNTASIMDRKGISDVSVVYGKLMQRLRTEYPEFFEENE